MKFPKRLNLQSEKIAALLLLGCFAAFSAGGRAASLNLDNVPLYINSNVKPIVMLDVTKDHQLHYKAYNDYTDLDGNGVVDSYETTYWHANNYYGYFDSIKCYAYDTSGAQVPGGGFYPLGISVANNKYCNSYVNSSGTTVSGVGVAWSGNFLNWVTMARMDVVRKLLYGGKRSTDTSTTTILERDLLPPDGHAFSRFYAGSDIAKLTPYNPPTTPTGGTSVTVRSTTTAPSCSGSPTTCSYGTSNNSVAIGSSATVLPSGTNNFTTKYLYYFRAPGISVCRGDQVKVNLSGNTSKYMVGMVWQTDQPDCATANTSGSSTTGFTLAVDHPTGLSGTGSSGSTWNLTDLTKTGISFCNLTSPAQGSASENLSTASYPPLLRVVQGNFALWGNNDSRICQWNPGGSSQYGLLTGGGNGNFASVTLGTAGLNAATSNSGSSGPPNTFVPASVGWASATSPMKSVSGLGYPVGNPGTATTYDLTVRVKACVSAALIGNEQCKQYGNNPNQLKPIGLLQVYGDPGIDLMSFGLFTGSYAKNKSGGVLRKNAGSFTDEVNSSTGQFLRPAAGSIVDNLDDFKLYGYYWGSTDSNGGTWGSYSDAVPPAGAPSDNCGIVQANSGSGPPGSYLNRGDFSEGRCGSWGNPISEMYLESLRYLAHKTPNPQFTYSGTVQDTVLGLSQPSWNDPLSANTYCAPLNTLVINAATQSFDSDQLGGITDLNTAQSAQQWTNTIGDSQHENINGGTWLIGNSGSVNDSTCSPKVISALGSASGICPDQPRYQGSYDIAGIAYEAHTNRIRTDLTVPASDANSLKVTTSALTLSPNVPKITIPVGAKTVTIMPAGKFEDQIVTFGPGQIVDFKIITTGTNATGPFGTYLVQWDESGQGADYELDIDGIISYQVNTSTSQITVSTKVAGRGGNGCDGFGYVISGTNKDGAHFFSGIQDSNSANWSINGGTGCLDPATATTSKPGFYYQYTSPSGTVTTECSACTIDNNPVVPSMSATYNVTGVGGTLNDPLWYVAKYGGFHDLNGNGRPDQVAEWDKVINSTGLDGSDGIPDNYFPVTNPGQLQISLDRAFTQILGVSSSTSVATNSTSLNTGTRVFQARFNSADWSGQLLSYPVDLNGNISNTADWDSGQQINTQLPTSRVIISYNPASGVAHNNSGIPFEWSNVSANATLAAYLNQNASGTVDALGSSRLAYLRGDASNEGTSANTFRRRPVSKLGDIINSNPQYVGAPGSTDVAHTSDPTYGTFASTYASRTPVVYMGANDGLLHGFNAVQSTASGGGDEVLGYVPSRIYSDLPKFMSQNYVHRYYVDGTAIVQDVCMPTPPLLANPCPAASNWKSVLVGDLRAGGQGVFALDVTDPSQFTEANANKLALWEFTDSDDADLGFVYGQPQIGKMANGQWAVVFGNGYNNTYSCTVRPCPNMGGAEGPLDNHASATGHGVVYILFIQPGATGSSWVAGTNYIKLDTMVGTAGSPNGLAQPALVDANGDGVIDYIYVGDLQGNMWKFDVTSSNPSNWKTAFGGVGSPVPLFTAKDASNNAQPITSAPVVYPNPNGGEMVLFGTGLYLQASDASNVSQQTLYGIWDNGSTVSGRSLLVSQSVLANVTTSAGTFRVTSQNAVNYTTAPTNTGWYMDFPNVNASGNPVYGSGTATGERVAYNPIISTQKLVVNTATPSANLCTAGGTTWTMDLDPISGGTLTFSPFDVNGDNNFTTSDLVTVNGTQYYVSGIASTVGIAPTPTVISGATGSGKEYKILSGSTGGLASVLENNPGAPPPAGPLKRRAWREIFRQ